VVTCFIFGLITGVGIMTVVSLCIAARVDFHDED